MTSRRANAQHCSSQHCANAHTQLLYWKRSSSRSCRACGGVFTGTDKQTTCAACKPRSHPYVKLDKIAVPLLCRSCLVQIGTHEKKLTAHAHAYTLGGLCAVCLSTSRQELSARRTGTGNPMWDGGRPVKARLSKVEVAARNSKRMKESNPMKSAAVRDRMSATFRAAVQDGRVVFKRGAAHHLWRGNRPAAQVIRARLGTWVRDVLVRNNFRCTHCGNGGTLEVHHDPPFRVLLRETLATLGVERLADVAVGSDLFETISAALLARHTPDGGVCLCKPCHAEHDPHRRIGAESRHKSASSRPVPRRSSQPGSRLASS